MTERADQGLRPIAPSAQLSRVSFIAGASGDWRVERMPDDPGSCG